MSGRAVVRRRSLVAAGGGTLLLALAACTSSSNAIDTGSANFPVGDQNIIVLAPDKRPTPGALHGPTVDGGTADVAALKGHVVVLNVWGSWCPPCRAEAPGLQAASQALAPKGVKFLGIDIREPGRDGAQAFQRTYGITYPSLYDESSDTLLALRGVVAANAIPSTIVLDGQGRIAARVSGKVTKDTLVDIVDDVVAGRTRAS